jgi:alpha-ketoglutarate-dependent taurine dioxygenase
VGVWKNFLIGGIVFNQLGSESIEVDANVDGNGLPLIIRNKGTGPVQQDWLANNSQSIIGALRSAGAILFRGFDVGTPERFRESVGKIVPGLLDYRGGTSPRTKIEDGVYTSTEYPNQYEIALHNEMSYSSQAPEFLFFACIIAPEDQGETPIADCRKVLKRLPPDLVAEFDKRRVMYERNMFGRKSNYNSWAKAFETQDTAVVERFCRESDIEFEWLPNDQLRTREIRPATCVHPVTGEAVWFNQVNLWHYTNSPLAASMKGMSEKGLPMNAFFGDGGSLNIEMLNLIRAAYAAEKRKFKWEQGDFLMIDNRLVVHGRMPFSGPRKIVVAMGNMASH